MTPQSNVTLVAPILPGCVDALRAVLTSMNDRPGMARPDNPLVPFGQFEGLHYARFVILDEETLGDSAAGPAIASNPVTLAFLADCDGPPDDLLVDMARRAGAGLRKIFYHCRDFAPETDLLEWMRQHTIAAIAAYVNTLGRTVGEVREEAALRHALVGWLEQHPPLSDEPQAIHQDLRAFVAREQAQGRLPLSPAKRTPLAWRIGELLDLAVVLIPVLLAAIVTVVLAVRFPLIVIPLLFAAVVILVTLQREYEDREPEVIERPTPEHAAMLARLEDHDVTNQLTVIDSVKPSLYRRLSAIVLLWAIGFGTRHLYNRGFLARIRTIHFARWVFLDDRRRLLFASNYDGSLEAHMDDLINKVGWGLNLACGSGVGYPRTRWFIKGGAKQEQKFKHTLRRHQVPTECWYKAYPGLTAFDLARNARVRRGIERASMSDGELRAWLHDL